MQNLVLEDKSAPKHKKFKHSSLTHKRLTQRDNRNLARIEKNHSTSSSSLEFLLDVRWPVTPISTTVGSFMTFTKWRNKANSSWKIWENGGDICNLELNNSDTSVFGPNFMPYTETLSLFPEYLFSCLSLDSGKTKGTTSVGAVEWSSPVNFNKTSCRAQAKIGGS